MTTQNRTAADVASNVHTTIPPIVMTGINNAPRHVVPANYVEAMILNEGAKFALAGEGERIIQIMKLDVDHHADVDGRKLSYVLVKDCDDDNVVMSISPADMISLLNNSNPEIGVPISDIRRPAAPAAATKKVAKVVKADKGPTKRQLGAEAVARMHTRARLLGTERPTRAMIIKTLAPILGMAPAGVATYANNYANGTYAITAADYAKAEEIVRAELAAEGIAIPGDEVTKPDAVVEMSDDEIATRMLSGEQVIADLNIDPDDSDEVDSSAESIIE